MGTHICAHAESLFIKSTAPEVVSDPDTPSPLIVINDQGSPMAIIKQKGEETAYSFTHKTESSLLPNTIGSFYAKDEETPNKQSYIQLKYPGANYQI